MKTIAVSHRSYYFDYATFTYDYICLHTILLLSCYSRTLVGVGFEGGGRTHILRDPVLGI